MDLILQQRQELKLLMTSQLRQSIELLQYSTNDLEQLIRQQELENPLIELQESDRWAQIEKLPSFQSARNTAPLFQATTINFRDQLMQLVHLSFKENEIEKLLEYIISHLDHKGYLEIDGIESPYSTEQLTKGIKLLQQIGPAGIGARSIAECLLLQINSHDPEYPMLKELIGHYLPLLAENKWKIIARKMNCSVAQIQKYNDLIQRLNPRPCLLSNSETTEYVHPDIIVENQEDELIFYLNEHYLPKIHLNEYYLNTSFTNLEDRHYIHNHYKNYRWLVSSIEQRRHTITQIMHVLIKKQLPFFRNGLSSLVPLTLKEVADEIGMHESTVSRATSNKYVQTPAGTFEMKALFTSKVLTNDGKQISQEKVKTLVKQIIQKENKYQPYSDQKISEYLNTEYAIRIARRTVSKYREELKIPTASMRRKWQ